VNLGATEIIKNLNEKEKLGFIRHNKKIKILENLLSLWLWKYEKESDLIRHWEIYYEPINKAGKEKQKEIINLLEKVKVKGGKSSVGVIAKCGVPIILNDTADDPRSSVSLEDYLIRDFSWIGIPVTDEKSVRLVVSFFLPYINAWGENGEEIKTKLCRLIKKYEDKLLLFHKIDTLDNEISCSLELGTLINPDEKSLMNIIEKTKISNPTLGILFKKVENNWLIVSPEYIFIDIKEIENRLLHELQWCTNVGISECDECKKLFESDDENFIFDLLGISISSNISYANIYSPNEFSKLKYSYLNSINNTSLIFDEESKYLFSILEFFSSKNSNLIKADKKRLLELRTTIFNFWYDLLLGLLTGNQLEQQIYALKQIIKEIGKIDNENKLNYAEINNKINELKGFILNRSKDNYTQNILHVEYWEKDNNVKLLKVVRPKSIKCVHENLKNFPRNESLELKDEERYFKHSATLSVLNRLTDSISENDWKDIEKIQNVYCPIFSLLNYGKIIINNIKPPIVFGGKDTMFNTYLEFYSSDNKHMPKAFRLNYKLIKKLLYDNWYKSKSLDNPPLDYGKLTDIQSKYLSPRWESYEYSYAFTSKDEMVNDLCLVFLNVQNGNGNSTVIKSDKVKERFLEQDIFKKYITQAFSTLASRKREERKEWESTFRTAYHNTANYLVAFDALNKAIREGNYDFEEIANFIDFYRQGIFYMLELARYINSPRELMTKPGMTQESFDIIEVAKNLTELYTLILSKAPKHSLKLGENNDQIISQAKLNKLIYIKSKNSKIYVNTYKYIFISIFYEILKNAIENSCGDNPQIEIEIETIKSFNVQQSCTMMITNNGIISDEALRLFNIQELENIQSKQREKLGSYIISFWCKHINVKLEVKVNNNKNKTTFILQIIDRESI
jgi:hypothetical protein